MVRAHSYAVTATDAAGNTSAMGAALSFTVDASGPAQPGAPADAAVANGLVNAAHDTAGQTIGGTTEAGASVAVYDNGTQVGTAVADGSGAWSFQVGSLADGSAHSYTVTATDAAGNASAMGAALNFVVGSGGPAQPGAPVDGSVSNGAVNAAHDTAAQSISGTTEAGASVAIYDNGTQVGTTTADGAGAWSYQVGALADGSAHSYAVTATDGAGNTSVMGAPLSFTVDASAPGQPAAPADVSVSNGLVNAAHDTAGQTISGTTEAGASVAVYDNGTQVGTAVADGSGAWSYQVGTLADGSSHSYAVTATDAAGNTSTMGAALAFTVDTSAPAQPAAPADGAVSNGYVNAAHDTAGQTITGAAEAGASVTIYDNGTQVGTATADGSGAWSYQVGALGDGSAHSYAVTSTDAAGNTSAMSAAVGFTVDTSAPGQPAAPTDAAVSNGYVDAAHDTASQTIGGTVEAGASVAVYDNGTQVATVVADGSGAWTYQVGVLGDGSSHSYTVTATDAAGNTSAMGAALNFTVGAGAPLSRVLRRTARCQQRLCQRRPRHGEPDHQRRNRSRRNGPGIRQRDPGRDGNGRRLGGLELPGRRPWRWHEPQLHGHRDRRGQQHQRDERRPELHRRHQRPDPAGRAGGQRGQQRLRQRRPRHRRPDHRRDGGGGRFGRRLRQRNPGRDRGRRRLGGVELPDRNPGRRLGAQLCGHRDRRGGQHQRDERRP